MIGVLSGEDEEKVKIEANRFYQIVAKEFEAYAPVPAPISKINKQYRWRVLIKTSMTGDVIEKLEKCLQEFEARKA